MGRIDPAVVERVRELPDLPGIYIFRAADGAPLYVGKAKSLRKRASNYLQPNPEARLGAMIGRARSVDWVITATEADALLLENNWIKEYQPRFNIRLRDDKTYPYIKLTLAEAWPKVAFTRRVRDDGAEYFGPFLPAGLARRAIKLVQKLFEVRVCHIEIDGSLPRPCLYWDMKRCLGPCVDGLTTAEEYQRAVERSRLFLAGRNQPLLAELKREMKNASDRLEFESAARLRDTLREIESISEARSLSSARGDDCDIFAAHIRGDCAAVQLFVMRGGQVLDRREYFWEGEAGLTEHLLLSELLPQVYDRTSFIPPEILVPVEIEGREVLEGWLGERSGRRVRVHIPQRGVKLERIAFARRNAQMSFRRRFRLSAELMVATEKLRDHLGLEDVPTRIEGFDISTLHGGETVASMVVWQGGQMAKRHYRSFNIRGLDAADDFESLRQAVSRAYRRRLDEEEAMPDLILIDGGRGQLNAALEALERLGVEETPVVSLAKREEEIYLPDHPNPLRLERRDAGLRLLQEIRDESHRFALSRHRNRRSAKALHSQFDDIPGVGPKRRKLLIERFGSWKGFTGASSGELQDALGPALGRRVFAWRAADSESGSATEEGEAT